MTEPTNISSAEVVPHPPYDARTVANYLLEKHSRSVEGITQLRLFKLIYFSHGWYLVEFDRPLVWNSFEAWERGPVIKAVRDCFKKFGSKAITGFASHFDFRLGRDVEFPRQLAGTDEKFVDAVVAAYQKYSGYELSEMTHEPGDSWDRVWKARSPVGRFGLRIKDHEIREDFQDIAFT